MSSRSSYNYSNVAEEDYEYERPERNYEIVHNGDVADAKRRLRVRRNQDKALQMDMSSVAVICIAAVILMIVCVQYIRVQSDITTLIDNIDTAQTELEAAVSNNNLTESMINSYEDLDYIYEVATEQLGMVYPSSGQVVYFQSQESEYVRQFSEIPTD